MLRRKESSLSKIVEQTKKPGVLGNLGHAVLRVVFDIRFFFKLLSAYDNNGSVCICLTSFVFS